MSGVRVVMVVVWWWEKYGVMTSGSGGDKSLVVLVALWETKSIVVTL